MRGEGWCLNGDLWTGVETFFSSGWECVAAFFGAWICSSVAKTSAIRGRTFASLLRHRNARCAAMKAPFWGYWPSNLVSIIRNNLRFSPKYGFAQSTRFCSMPIFDLSTARRPDNNSNSTTPKLYTSLFADSRPVHREH
ncbi:hypothetical protein NE237_008042 [Protea cynaroides]|uniref:Uncharacterized protein n=1 Tax=Protea cynaroides TaxID=273540 RepID=A0A9Q0KQ88_9MAGN|nr:hypothetical protein NE237_008042 [Protea cynaroides]